MKGILKKIEGEWFASIDENTNIDIHPDYRALLDSLEGLGWVNQIKEVNFEIKSENGADFARLAKSPENPLGLQTQCYCGHTDWCDCLPYCDGPLCEDIKNNLRASLIYDGGGSTFLQWLFENYSIAEKKENE